MLSIKMKSLSFSTGTGTYISLQIPAHLFPRAFFIMKALVYQNAFSLQLQFQEQLLKVISHSHLPHCKMSHSLKCLSCPLTSYSGPLTTTVSQWKTLPKSGPTVKKLAKMKTIVNIFLFYSLTALLHLDGNDNCLKTSLG